MERPVRVVLAVRHPRSRYGLRALLATLEGVEVVGEAANGPQALRCVEECQPDVVLVDLQMPGQDGLETSRRIKERWPEVRIVALTLYAGDRGQAMEAGADSVLVKGCPADDFAASICLRSRPPTRPEPPLRTGLLAPVLSTQMI